MTTKTVYKYNTKEGGVAILPFEVVDFETMLRIWAEPGKLITNGISTGKTFTVPADQIDTYYEIDDTDESLAEENAEVSE